MNEELIKYKQLKEVINSGSFKLEGNAIVKVASLLVWFNGLEGKFSPKPPEIKVDKVTQPVAKPVRKKKAK